MLCGPLASRRGGCGWRVHRSRIDARGWLEFYRQVRQMERVSGAEQAIMTESPKGGKLALILISMQLRPWRDRLLE